MLQTTNQYIVCFIKCYPYIMDNLWHPKTCFVNVWYFVNIHKYPNLWRHIQVLKYADPRSIHILPYCWWSNPYEIIVKPTSQRIWANQSYYCMFAFPFRMDKIPLRNCSPTMHHLSTMFPYGGPLSSVVTVPRVPTQFRLSQINFLLLWSLWSSDNSVRYLPIYWVFLWNTTLKLVGGFNASEKYYYNATLGTLRTFTWEPWKPWGNLEGTFTI